VLARVVVDGPGKGGDGDDQGGQRDRVQVPLRALLGVAGGQSGLNLRRQAGPRSGARITAVDRAASATVRSRLASGLLVAVAGDAVAYRLLNGMAG